MKNIWSYLLMALCVTVTSARVMDFPGNRNGFLDNLISGVENEKILTPPSTSGLIIDSNGYPGNSNGKAQLSRTPPGVEIENFKPENSQLLFNEIIQSLFNQTIESKYNIIPFSKNDIINMEKSDLCKIMCEFGVKKPPCKCK